jgi:16S rRNA C1402 N4-methylase RsmH
MSKEHPPHHIPVLLDATLEALRPQAGESYLDLTAGYGGHAGEVLKRTENLKESVLVDRDDYAIAHLSTPTLSQLLVSLSKKGSHLTLS